MFDDDFAADFAVWYDTSEWAHACALVAPPAPEVPFAGILGAATDDNFTGQAQTVVHLLRYPTKAVALHAGSTLRTQRTVAAGAPVPPAQWWRVLRTPELVTDGLESQAYLHPAAAPAPAPTPAPAPAPGP